MALFAMIRKSLTILMFLSAAAAVLAADPQQQPQPQQQPGSDVGLVPEHHQPNPDGTLTDVAPLMPQVPVPQMGPGMGSNIPFMPPQQQQPQQLGQMGPVPNQYGPPQAGGAYGNEQFNPDMGQGPMQGQVPQMMPQQPQQQPPSQFQPQMNANNGYNGPAPNTYGGYGVNPSNGYNRQPQMQPQPMSNNYQNVPSQYNGYGQQPAASGYQPQTGPYGSAPGSPVVDPMMAMSGKMMYPGANGQPGIPAGSPGMDSVPYFRRR